MRRLIEADLPVVTADRGSRSESRQDHGPMWIDRCPLPAPTLGMTRATGTGAIRGAGRLAAEAEADEEALDREAGMILSALDAAAETSQPRSSALNRRGGSRNRYRTRAQLRLFAEGPDAPAWTLFTRNISPRSAGFVCPDRLPLGYGGTLTLLTPDGRQLTAEVILTRCSSCCGGWYEGALYFNRPQPELQQ